MSSLRRGPSLLAGVSLLVATTGVLAGCTDDPPSGIEVAAVDRADVSELVEAPATVQARAAVSVAAPASGRVAKLAVRDGVQVRAGQVLLTVESPGARAALKQAEQADAQLAASARITVPRSDTAVIDSSQASARRAFTAARAAARAIPDAAAQRAALADVAAAEAEHTAALASARRTVRQVNAGLAGLARLAAALGQAQRVQTRAAVAAARATVDSLTVRAPISGVVVLGGPTISGSVSGAPAGAAPGADLLDQLPAELQGQAASLLGTGTGAAASTGGTLEVGLPVSAGSPLLTITDVSAWSVVASVDETDVPLVRAGVGAEVELDALPGQSLVATVRSVDLQPTASTRGGVSYQVRLALTFPPGSAQVREALRPGMSAVTRLQVRTAEDAVSVPAAAVFRDETGEAVWVVRDEVARRQAVRLGAQGLDRVEVTEGLAVGERVVVRGADAVTAGATVPP